MLFIDEAYNLFTGANDTKDFGMRVIETLLTYLSAENTDMIVILAGYTNEMEKMLKANPGMKSRFPYIFHFEDYTPKELMQIGKIVLEKEQYKMTPEAEKKLAKYVINEYDHKDEQYPSAFSDVMQATYSDGSIGEKNTQAKEGIQVFGKWNPDGQKGKSKCN